MYMAGSSKLFHTSATPPTIPFRIVERTASAMFSVIILRERSFLVFSSEARLEIFAWTARRISSEESWNRLRDERYVRDEENVVTPE